ncbi:MAG: hypothetical protein G01um101448_944 [Parcubacteria group bacterium Gr01-1014_48]|nr:MAG: hypothetical protein Greene041614_1142 [Parcubacteria group bacterium Greene0416_14]TSC72569.1 MAG: hypothetical protein G01um101448_944 [Parcubacteria group bacterium Gr01-1014_48]TSC99577.1 MAG: hypothetical protein Greene101415_1145 [Parcubacteria group bacterium Greene1014_15]TSD07227.1 MAG: hypothetical protein Greene07144_968 [Parcubacteria group bacterium Greene0714_4]
MNNGMDENHRDHDDHDEQSEIIDTALVYLLENGARGVPQALAGVGLAILALADQVRQSNLIHSAEVFGFLESDENELGESDEEL